MGKKFKKVEGNNNIWMPKKENDELIGIILEVKEGQFGKQYEIGVDDGSSIWTPSHKVLQNRLTACKKGDNVKIVFTGQELPKVKGYNPTALYDVYIEE